MRDKRPVDELSIEELERILAIRKREQRMARVQGYRESGRTLAVPLPDSSKALSVPPAALHESASQPVNNLAQLEQDYQEVRFVDDLPATRAVLVAERAAWRQRISGLLLLTEIAAVAGLAIVLYLAFTGLDDIQSNTSQTQRELVAIRERSRITPTPLPDLTPSDIIIPGGHTPYDENGQTSFNFVELDRAFAYYNIPDSARPALIQEFSPVLVQQYRSGSATTSSRRPGDPEYLTISRLGIREQSIYNGADWETLREGVGWFNNGALPGTRQNVVLVGHNDIYGEIFRNLYQLEPGDEITILAANGRRYTYRVTDQQIVEPTDVWVLSADSGAQLTLITCHPYQDDSQRLVVFAELVG